MTNLAIIMSMVFALCCGALAVFHSLRLGRLTLLDWAVLGIGAVYGVGWALVALVTKRGGNPVWEYWLVSSKNLYPVHTLSALILVGAICAGWAAANSFSRCHRPAQRMPRRAEKDRWTRAFWVLLLISFSLQCLYTRAHGGLIGYLQSSELIRSAIFETENPLSFLRPFGGLTLFACFGFFGLWFSRHRRTSVLLGLSLSFIFSLYILFSWLGRIGFLVFLATISLGFALTQRRSPLVFLVRSIATLAGIVVGAYFVSIWFSLKAADGLCEFLARELAFPFVSFFAQFTSEADSFRMLKDVALAPVYLLPSSWWTGWIDEVSQLNTALIIGASKGVNGVTTGVPVDLLTLGMMQLSLIGVVIVGGLFGVLLEVLQRLIDGIQISGVRSIFEAYIALKIAVLGVFYAQPAHFISGNFALLLSALIIAVFLRVPGLNIAVIPRQRSLVLRAEGKG